jgi:hypothetical protein
MEEMNLRNCTSCIKEAEKCIETLEMLKHYTAVALETKRVCVLILGSWHRCFTPAGGGCTWSSAS